MQPSRSVPGRDWIGVADVRLTYWRTTDPAAEAPTAAPTDDEGDVLTEAPAEAPRPR